MVAVGWLGGGGGGGKLGMMMVGYRRGVEKRAQRVSWPEFD